MNSAFPSIKTRDCEFVDKLFLWNVFCLYIYVFSITAAISTLSEKKTIEEYKVQRAPAAALASHGR